MACFLFLRRFDANDSYHSRKVIHTSCCSVPAVQPMNLTMVTRTRRRNVTTQTDGGTSITDSLIDGNYESAEILTSLEYFSPVSSRKLHFSSTFVSPLNLSPFSSSLFLFFQKHFLASPRLHPLVRRSTRNHVHCIDVVGITKHDCL